MAEWIEKCLEGVPSDQVLPLLKGFGFSNPDYFAERIITNAALCRLAFASIIESDEEPAPYSVPDEAIISKTAFGMAKGRPKTAQWAFWLSYITKQELSGIEGSITARFLSKLIGLLLVKLRPKRCALQWESSGKRQ